MKIDINNETYTKLRDLNFAPQSDMSGSTVPVNEFSVDIVTTDTISAGMAADLKSNDGTLWASYWIIYAERAADSAEGSLVHIRAQSRLALLDRVTMPAVMYNAASVATVMAAIFSPLGASSYSLASSFTSATVTGFCPEQTARERLQWVCLVIGAYIKTFFTTKAAEILALSSSETLILPNKTFWRPSVNYSDYVTAVKVKGYAYTSGAPATMDKWVTDGTTTWIETEQEYQLLNPDVPEGVPTREVTVEGVGLIHSGNVSAILSRLALYYFKRMSADVTVINSGEYLPGDRVIVYTAEDALAVGYIESCNFRFGHRSASQLKMTPVEVKESATLTIQYKYGDKLLDTRTLTLPVGYIYCVDNPDMDLEENDHRYVFLSLTPRVSGTMAAGGSTVVVNYQLALDLDYVTRVLAIYAADATTTTTEDGVTVVEIA